jgi:hypothetical protein
MASHSGGVHPASLQALVSRCSTRDAGICTCSKRRGGDACCLCNQVQGSIAYPKTRGTWPGWARCRGTCAQVAHSNLPFNVQTWPFCCTTLQKPGPGPLMLPCQPQDSFLHVSDMPPLPSSALAPKTLNPKALSP